MSIITRFAPSPTGTTHIGGIRTALFNYFFAKSLPNGKFILRIEDTDQNRYVPGAVDNLLHSLDWVNLKYDGDPIFQSTRTELYQEYAHSLMDKGFAYPCFCDSHRLESVREKQMKKGLATSYDRHCLFNYTPAERKDMIKSEKFTIRQLIPTNQKIVQVEDVVHGTVIFRPKQINDQILLKTDSFPTYHLANVIDDHLMGITHVIRGEEWLTSTPKHVLLYEAFGWKPPVWAHVPLLLDSNRNKLSKRTGSGDISGKLRNLHGFQFPFHSSDSGVELSLTPNVETISRAGILPDALINFLVLLGWYPGSSQEFFTPFELEQKFNLKGFNNSNSIVDWNKLIWFNEQHMKHLSFHDPPHLTFLFLQYLNILKSWFDESFQLSNSDSNLNPNQGINFNAYPDLQTCQAILSGDFDNLESLFIKNQTTPGIFSRNENLKNSSKIQQHPYYHIAAREPNLSVVLTRSNLTLCLEAVFKISCDRVSTFEDYLIPSRHSYFFCSPWLSFTPKSSSWIQFLEKMQKNTKIPLAVIKETLLKSTKILYLLASSPKSSDFTNITSSKTPFGEEIMFALSELCKESQIKPAQLFYPLRYLITGTHGGPHLGSIIHIIGIPETCDRIITGVYQLTDLH